MDTPIPQRRQDLPNGSTLSYREIGRGNPSTIVALHGIGSSSVGWLPQMARLGQRFHVIAWDAPGYGDSSPLGPHARAEDYTRRLSELLQALDVQRAHFAASSWGTLIASAFASHYPQMAQTLFLSGPTKGLGALPAAQRRAIVEQRQARIRQLGPQAMADQDIERLVAPAALEQARPYVRMGASELSIDGYSQALDMMGETDGIQNIAGLKLPIFILAGEDDQIAPPADHARKLASAAPHAELLCLPSCGHLPHLEMQDEFQRRLTAFCTANDIR